MESIFGSSDWIAIFLKLVIAAFILLSVVLPLRSFLLKAIEEKTLLVYSDEFGALSPYVCFVGAVAAYSLLVAYEHPPAALAVLLMGLCCITGLAGVIGSKLLQRRMFPALPLDLILRILKLK